MRRMLKNLIEHMPYLVGHWLSRVPFEWRLGKAYSVAHKKCIEAQAWSDARCERYAVEHFRRIFEYAKIHFSCYRRFYESAGVSNLEIQTLADIRKVSLIDKQWVRNRTNEFKGAYKLFSGGTTGTLTPFWMDKDC